MAILNLHHFGIQLPAVPHSAAETPTVTLRMHHRPTCKREQVWPSQRQALSLHHGLCTYRPAAPRRAVIKAAATFSRGKFVKPTTWTGSLRCNSWRLKAISASRGTQVGLRRLLALFFRSCWAQRVHVVYFGTFRPTNGTSGAGAYKEERGKAFSSGGHVCVQSHCLG